MPIRVVRKFVANPEGGASRQKVRDPEQVGVVGAYPHLVIYSPIPSGEGPVDDTKTILEGMDEDGTWGLPVGSDRPGDWVEKLRQKLKLLGIDPEESGVLDGGGVEGADLGDIISGRNDYWGSYGGLSGQLRGTGLGELPDPLSLVSFGTDRSPGELPGTTRATAGKVDSSGGGSVHGTEHEKVDVSTTTTVVTNSDGSTTTTETTVTQHRNGMREVSTLKITKYPNPETDDGQHIITPGTLEQAILSHPGLGELLLNHDWHILSPATDAGGMIGPDIGPDHFGPHGGPGHFPSGVLHRDPGFVDPNPYGRSGEDSGGGGVAVAGGVAVGGEGPTYPSNQPGGDPATHGG